MGGSSASSPPSVSAADGSASGLATSDCTAGLLAIDGNRFEFENSDLLESPNVDAEVEKVGILNKLLDEVSGFS